MARGHLTQDERYQVQALVELGFSKTAIGKRIHRSPSTVARELLRNGGPDGYKATRAHAQWKSRRRKASQAPRISALAWQQIEGRLREEHSPEQIAGTTGLASHERIYQHIAADRSTGGDLHRHLRHGHARRKRRVRPDRRGKIRFRRDITERPAEVEARGEIGHWEVDTMVKAGGGMVLVTMTERRSMLHLIRRVAARTAEEVTRAIVGTLHGISDWVLTMTADNGKEFAGHETIAIALATDFFFAAPYASWQRGTNENHNGLVRQYLPKGIDFATVSDAEIAEIERRINTRPRKTLGFRTPLEVFLEETQTGVAI